MRAERAISTLITGANADGQCPGLDLSERFYKSFNHALLSILKSIASKYKKHEGYSLGCLGSKALFYNHLQHPLHPVLQIQLLGSQLPLNNAIDLLTILFSAVYKDHGVHPSAKHYVAPPPNIRIENAVSSPNRQHSQSPYQRLPIQSLNNSHRTVLQRRWCSRGHLLSLSIFRSREVFRCTVAIKKPPLWTLCNLQNPKWQYTLRSCCNIGTLI